jgi:hypothetical protein
VVVATGADLERQPSRGWAAVRVIGKALTYLTVPLSLTIGPHITSIVGMLIPLYLVAAIGFGAAIRGARIPPLIVNVGLALLAWYCILFAIEIANNDLARFPRPLHADFLTTYFVLLAFPFLTIGLREVRADLAALDRAVMATIALAAAWTLYQFFFMNVDRPGGFNGFNPIPYAMVVAIWSAYLLARALRSRQVDLVKVAVALLGLVPVLLSGSKLVWGCAAAGYSIVFFAWVWARRGWLVLGAAVLLTAAASAALYPTRIVQSRLAPFTADLVAFATAGDTTGPTFGARFATSVSGFHAFLERPFLGYGLADVKVAALTHRPASIDDFTRLSHLHNEYITHMVAFGILGLGFLLFLPATFGAIAWRTGDAGMRRFGVATAAGLMLYMAAELVFPRPNICGTLFFLLGFMVVAAADSSQPHEPSDARP